MLRIDERELKAKLNEHKSLIGWGSLGDGISNVIAGVFYIVTAWTTSGLQQPVQWTLYALGAIIIVIGVAALFSKRLSAAKLYKEIETMNRRPSSLIAVRDGGKLSNRYLTYYDEPWGCWFLPNHRSCDSYSEDKAKISEYLATEFKIPESDFSLGFVGTTTSTKWSTAHNEERTYDYRLYMAKVSAIPAEWQLDGEFNVGSKRCRWMTLDDMRNDSKIYEINFDVIQMLGDLI
ncbi:DUF308 domain-containing protein [Bifidobacterium dentium]|uniref:DUF308 domain-containing protein n=1 Tax=Bifidobacterium dentium TaxID=1689 RepID=UPI0018B09C5F|nr:DUF308 domain-containing protein [Bifidobacterium dentium]MBF9694125.1 DUF308 domain-containing protein [Bifidobacterium dentium]